MPLALIAVLSLQVITQANAVETTIIRDVRLFDGEMVYEQATVVIKGDLIDSIVVGAADGTMTQAAIVIDGKGLTLMPGLIDAHTHTFSRAMLERSLAFGVTTHIDMFTGLTVMQALQAEQNNKQLYDRADFVSAGLVATAPHGHGTQFGLDIPTLAEDDDASAFVADRINEGSDFIKLIMDDFSVVGFDIPTLSAAQVDALVTAAHQYEKLAVVHARDLEGYLASVGAGVDGIVHGLSETVPNEELLKLMAEMEPFVIPTLTATEGTQGGDGGSLFAQDEDIGPLLTDREKEMLQRTRFENPKVTFDFSVALRSAGMLHANGTMIVTGTDSPNPGTTAGASIHRELELLVAAGLSPIEALQAATANGAAAFGLSDRGRIKPGLRADLLLVAGNPTVSITDSRKIAAVWKSGRQHQAR